MGDISEMRALIVLFALVAVVISLVLLIPSEFYVSSVTNKATPSLNDINDIIAWNQTLTVNFTSPNVFETFDLNGYHFYFIGGSGYTVPSGYIGLYTYAVWGPFIWDLDYFTWYSQTGTVVSVPTGLLNKPAISYATIDDYGIGYVFRVENTKVGVDVVFAYNTTTYSSFSDAINAGEAYAILNSDWSDRNSSMNALQLVGMVLTGSLPDIDPVLSVLFGFIGWAVIAAAAYLMFIFVLRIAGAIFGGGGA